ncbi:leucine--tRNA ligase [candidate division KSB1 bacterium]|nr:leucine--tRNA ligase [candidate division KSB1 bacterium]
MQNEYQFETIEKKWQKRWQDSGLYSVDIEKSDRKLYCLVMFLYPSGDKLHIGHWYNYAPTDSWARFKRMQGYQVFEPMGYDAFGLPAENYAIKKGVHPKKSTENNIRFIREQLKALGAMYDWDKEINTSDPGYYKWTQWMFLQLYKHNLAYRKKAAVNWCPSCTTVLANEQVIEGQCERCESEVETRDLEQWFFKITDYSERLLEGHDRIDWPEKTITMQKNWIGKSTGALIGFPLADADDIIQVFTTRPDTVYGVTYMVLAPEHPLVAKITTAAHQQDVKAYIERTRRTKEIDRLSTEREKTGVFTGSYCLNPVNNKRVEIWIADYVLVTYGTGAVMAVPAHDQRDFEFATRYGLEIIQVISPHGKPTSEALECAFEDPGIMIHSGTFDGTPSVQGKQAVIDYLQQNGWGEAKINFRLRDWLISRQRYWGAPIPIVYCDTCGETPVPEKDLPVLLPDQVEFSGQGQSPLSTNPDFVNTTCPTCGGPARREVDTMDTFVCSSWYFLRFPNPHLSDKAFDPEIIKKWLPVDQYVGGSEHANMHLLYARFFTKALYDFGYINFDEPFTRLVHQGIITNAGAKMSKSRGNVVNPDVYVEKYGADTFRVYMMFMGSYEEGGDWNDEGIIGINKWIKRVWRLIHQINDQPPQGNENDRFKIVLRQMHYAIKMIGIDMERFHFNTCISRIMELINEMYLYIQDVPVAEQNATLIDVMHTLVKLLAPFTPHLAEEVWHELGNSSSVFDVSWPEYDEEQLTLDTIQMGVQINGKIRAQMQFSADASDQEIIEATTADDKVQKYMEGKKIVKSFVVKNKLVILVVK